MNNSDKSESSYNNSLKTSYLLPLPGGTQKEEGTEQQIFDVAHVFEDDKRLIMLRCAYSAKIFHFVKTFLMSTLLQTFDFMMHHSILPCDSTDINLPFKAKTYYPNSQYNIVERRKCVSSYLKYNKMFCSVCMFFFCY